MVAERLLFSSDSKRPSFVSTVSFGGDPVHIDDLARKLSMESGRLSSVLLQLELKNIVQQSPGKFFSIAERV